MKKLSVLFVFAIFCLTSTTTFAQEVKEAVKKEVKVDKAEVAVADLPDAIQKTLKESFADYKAKKAYKAKASKDGIAYYVKLEKDGKWLKVALDGNGKVLKKKEIQKKGDLEKKNKVG